MFKSVAARVRPDDKSDHLLLPSETDDVGPYQLPPPREIAGLETCECSITGMKDRFGADVGAIRCSGVVERACCKTVGDICVVSHRDNEWMMYLDNSRWQ